MAMAQFIDSSGSIEIIAVSPLHKAPSVGEQIKLAFLPVSALNPPYKLKITSPTGKAITDILLRDLPTGEAQSAPPFEFSPMASGVYQIEIREVRGHAYGTATLRII